MREPDSRVSAGLGADLSFLSNPAHRQIIQEVLEEAQGDDEVVGVLLMGSVARGDAGPGSDLDLMFMLAAGRGRPFRSTMCRDTLVEIHHANLEQASGKLRRNPMWVYGYLDGRILYDREGLLSQLVAYARHVRETYTVEKEELDGIIYWLSSARLKMIAAREVGDHLKASFVASTTSWKIVEGLWAVNGKPVPPAGSIWAHLNDLHSTPQDFPPKFGELFVGDSAHRVDRAIGLIDWIVSRAD